ncbi:phosphopantothenoylcysteine decarboxylase [Paenibacillus swuensis]|uniref:Coenzyme A biosynthesis bifunctional protein CoaBC n=1 Tax=Paenibacillus swuensis TaxID=1178515 RepID=A0A172TKY5_9BACL|nr:bifunctional phosphopantothenoylcysteine decarboxylase/phosphopantothenate--cysteine ligase CoaBC [Paenibacillus swuensis]ANE47477.1 phosphopantothenoylcysteine decarboxylase [Paenibacillus swuensis]
MLHGKTIVLGISGGIAAFKAASLCSKLVAKGASVQVIMTASAAKFITPLTLQTISRNPVYMDTFDEKDPSVVSHINIADSADLIVIAPATANVIGKLANGIADDMLSTTLLAATAPILIAPAMNVHMYAHPAVEHNMRTLASRGVTFIDPNEGQLACGYVGKGRLAEPDEIVDFMERFMSEEPLLAGRRVLITAGGTIERLDPVRYITNDSSGKMGFAIAAAARRMGAEVVLVAGNTSAGSFPEGVQHVQALSAQEMYDAVLRRLADTDIVIMAAAVSDYRPKSVAPQKMKKTGENLILELERTPDILQTVGQRKGKTFVVGFAAETEHLEEYAMDKLQRKNCDLLVANDVSQEGAGFGTDTNIAQIYNKDGLLENLPMMTKPEMACRLLRIIASTLEAAGDRV